MRDEKTAQGDPGMAMTGAPWGFLVLARSQGFVAGFDQEGEWLWEIGHSPAQSAGSQAESWHGQQTQPEPHLEWDGEMK